MELIVERDVEAVARRAADLVEGILAAKPEAHLCLAAGATPRPVYAEVRRRGLDLSRVRVSKLDEWLGVPRDDPATCESDLRRHLLGPCGITAEQYLGFDSMAADPEAECARVRARLREWGRFDLSVLGLGLNGHLGMNEPAEELVAGAHVAELTEESRGHSMLRHLAEPPTQGMTMGMADLLKSARVLVIVTGEAKREALKRMVEGPMTTEFPASLLQLHGECVCVADEAAAGGEEGLAGCTGLTADGQDVGGEWGDVSDS